MWGSVVFFVKAKRGPWTRKFAKHYTRQMLVRYHDWFLPHPMKFVPHSELCKLCSWNSVAKEIKVLSVSMAQRFPKQHYFFWSLMLCWPRIIVYQNSETNVMHFLFSLLRINDLYMFRAYLINWIKSASRWFHYTDFSEGSLPSPTCSGKSDMQLKMNVEYWRNEADGEIEVLGENPLSMPLCTTHIIWPRPGSSRDLRVEKPPINGVRHGRALFETEPRLH
jgi:hypothetical protein